LSLFDPLPSTQGAEWRGQQSFASAPIEPPFFDLELETLGQQMEPTRRPLNGPMQSPAPAPVRFQSASSEIPVNDKAATVDDYSAPETSIAPNVRDPKRPRLAELPFENSGLEHRATRTNGAQSTPDSTHPIAPRVNAISRLQSTGGEKAEPAARNHEKINPTTGPPHRSTRPAQTNLVPVRSIPARPVTSRSSRPAASLHSVSAESAINVTIGRVEVRATLPAVAAPTPRRNSPIVSLDEYLRQRAKGAGR
jgi:hypothetical protein